MALIKFSGVAGDASGKLGGLVFARNRGGSYVRSFAAPVNKRTEGQLRARSAFGMASTEYANLSPSDRQIWDEYGEVIGYVDRFGERRSLQGNAAFVRARSLIYQIRGVEKAGAPPVPEAIMEGPTLALGAPNVANFIKAAGGEVPSAFSINADIEDTAPAGTDVFLIVQYSRAQGPARMSPSGLAYRMFPGPPAEDSGTSYAFFEPTSVGMAAEVSGSYPFPATAGTVIFVRARTITSDGRIGPPVYQRLTVLPGPTGD